MKGRRQPDLWRGVADRALRGARLLVHAGFWGPEEASRALNPGAANASAWASRTGQAFVANHRPVDYATIHFWPDNWRERSPGFRDAWLAAHVAEAAGELGKPLLLEEVGRKMDPAPASAEQLSARRDPVYAAVYEAVEASIAQGGALVGSLYWDWYLPVYGDASPYGPYAVSPNDSTFGVIAAHAGRVRAHAQGRPPAAGCAAGRGGRDCWVGVEALRGLLRRCEYSPKACQYAREAAAEGAGEAWDEAARQLVAPGVRIYRSQGECCRPGSGAFAQGCSQRGG